MIINWSSDPGVRTNPTGKEVWIPGGQRDGVEAGETVASRENFKMGEIQRNINLTGMIQ